jgi:hypothetical protein
MKIKLNNNELEQLLKCFDWTCVLNIQKNLKTNVKKLNLSSQVNYNSDHKSDINNNYAFISEGKDLKIFLQEFFNSIFNFLLWKSTFKRILFIYCICNINLHIVYFTYSIL